MHSPEPWDYAEYLPGMCDTWMGGEPPDFAHVHIAGRDDYPDHVILWANQDNDRHVQDANVRRVVACVNACQGIPTEALEAFAAKGVLGQLWKEEWEHAFNERTSTHANPSPAP